MNPPSDRRASSDRRQRRTPLLNRYFLWGRRRAPRRESEDPCYVDRPRPLWSCFALLVVALGLADLAITEYELGLGCATEGNVIMHWLLERSGNVVAWGIKTIVTLLGAGLLLAHHRWRYGGLGLMVLTLYYAGLLIFHGTVLLRCW
ncbi:MAG: hypothetical protein HY696_11210 [Deltaproteobacteria bacterium]|nr:hypothetical protein [Deltaproteobacteria bacterium]